MYRFWLFTTYLMEISFKSPSQSEDQSFDLFTKLQSSISIQHFWNRSRSRCLFGLIETSKLLIQVPRIVFFLCKFNRLRIFCRFLRLEHVTPRNRNPNILEAFQDWNYFGVILVRYAMLKKLFSSWKNRTSTEIERIFWTPPL